MIKQDIRPPVTISAGDYDRLAFLASFGLNFQQDRSAAAMLADELIRATVLTPRAIPPSVATMHSRFRPPVGRAWIGAGGAFERSCAGGEGRRLGRGALRRGAGGGGRSRRDDRHDRAAEFRLAALRPERELVGARLERTPGDPAVEAEPVHALTSTEGDPAGDRATRAWPADDEDQLRCA